MNHEGRAAFKPPRGRLREAAAPFLYHDKSTARLFEQSQRLRLDGIAALRAARCDENDLISGAQRRVRPRVQVGIDDANDEIVLAFDLGQPGGQFIALNGALGEAFGPIRRM